MIEPGEYPESDLPSSDRVNTVFFMGRLGCRELEEINVPYITAPDGSIGVAAAQIGKIARMASGDTIVWIHATEGIDLSEDDVSEEKSVQTIIADGRVMIDHARMELEVDGEIRHLTTAQFRIIDLLARKLGRPAWREEILDAIHGDHSYRNERIVDIQVCVIRKALGEDCSQLLVTKRGIGYVLEKNFRPLSKEKS